MKKIFVILLFFFLFVFTSAFTSVAKKTIEEKIIYIDPGHGGIDSGTSANGIKEKNINLLLSQILKESLEYKGYKVLLTRDGDYDLASLNSKNRKRDDMKKRVEMINSSNCLLYLSIHTNEFSDSSVHGAQTFYNSNNLSNKNLAIAIQNAIKNNLKNTKREAISITDKYLTDNIQKVGCLVEIGFISNNEELSLLQDHNYLLSMSNAIIEGVEEYLKTLD